MNVNLPTAETADMLSMRLAGMPFGDDGRASVQCTHEPTNSVLCFGKSIFGTERLLTLTLAGALFKIGVINNWVFKLFPDNWLFAVCALDSASVILAVSDDWRTGVPMRSGYRNLVAPMFLTDDEYPWSDGVSVLVKTDEVIA